MNREFIYNFQGPQPNVWERAGSTLNRWLWGALCCGVPGVPCHFCTCCEKVDDSSNRERITVNRTCSVESTATAADRLSRPHRPHAPGGRKSTPEMLSAVQCALTQLQGEPAPPPPPLPAARDHQSEPG